LPGRVWLGASRLRTGKMITFFYSVGREDKWAGRDITDKKENQIFLIYREIQSGAVSKSYIRKSFLIYEEMCKYFPIYEEAVSHI
jgi:hypothetical protein